MDMAPRPWLVVMEVWARQWQRINPAIEEEILLAPMETETRATPAIRPRGMVLVALGFIQESSVLDKS